MKRLETQELVALEYLVSSACNFLAELHEDTPGEFHFEPSDSAEAREVGEYQRGQRFWSNYGPRHFSTPFEAAIMFVNAFRIWDTKMREVETDPKKPAAENKEPEADTRSRGKRARMLH